MARNPNQDENVFARFFRRVPRQSRSRALVESILQALDEHADHQIELDKLKVETLAERAGVGIGSLYEYFATKDSLLGALIGRATQKNFDELVARLDGLERRGLQDAIRQMASFVADQYLTHPARTRLLISGIGRLGLWDIVVAERDRFARVLADRAHRYLPDADLAELEVTMRLVSDSLMGVIAAELSRNAVPDKAMVGEQLGSLAWSIAQARHAQAT